MAPLVRHLVRVVVVAVLVMASFVGAPAAQAGTTGDAHSQYGYPYPNAPDCNEQTGSNCVADAWRFYQGQCTSWVAYRLNQLNGIGFNNRYRGVGWGDASNWGNAARSLGIPVNGTPALGAVAWYSSGHVGYVEQVNSDGSVVMSEMNQNFHNNFQLVTIRPGNRWPTGFIHVADRQAPTGDGAFVSYQGNVYRIVGGAPVYVSSWDAVGGAQPATGLSDAQFAALPPYPADGTLVNTQTGAVYVFAGGAPLYVSSWGAIGGERPSTRVDQFALDRAGEAPPFNYTRRYPVDSTLVSGRDGATYVFAGGAPLYVSSWDAIGGSRPATRVDQAALDTGGATGFPWGGHVRKYPADGTTVTGSQGAVYVFAGGAPLYVSSWDAIGGSRPSTQVDQAALDTGGVEGFPWGHVTKYPLDGTAVNVASGHVFVFAGGAPLYVTSWDAIGGERPSTRVDRHALDQGGSTGFPFGHTTAYPLAGTVLNPSDPKLSWVVGTKGVAQPVPRRAGVTTDQAALDNAGTAFPYGWLRSTGADVMVHKLPRRTEGRHVRVSWQWPVSSSATTGFDVRWRLGRHGWKAPQKWHAVEKTRVTLSGMRQPGRYCFSVRSHNRAGQVGTWSAPRCTRGV